MAMMGANATELGRLDAVQNAATTVYAEPLLFLFNVVVMLLQLDCC